MSKAREILSYFEQAAGYQGLLVAALSLTTVHNDVVESGIEVDSEISQRISELYVLIDDRMKGYGDELYTKLQELDAGPAA